MLLNMLLNVNQILREEENIVILHPITIYI